MKIKLLLFSVVFIAYSTLSAQIYNLPYIQDFSGFPEDNATFGPGAEPNALVQDWVNIQTDDAQDWYGRSSATGSGNTGPISDHTTAGAGTYMFVEDGFGNNASVQLRSPGIDLLTTTSAVLLNYWAHSQSTSALGNSMVVKASNDLTTWITVDSFSILTTTNLWVERTADLSPFTGDTVYIMWEGSNNVTGFQHDIAIDDISIFPLVAIDLEANSVNIPTQCSYTATENITFTICNRGDTIWPIGAIFPVSYAINGGTSVTENITLAAALPTDSCVTYTFIAAGDLSAAGAFTVEAWTAQPGDILNVNDTTSISGFNSIGNNLPFFQNFETGEAGWTIGGVTSFDLGLPANTIIDGAASGDSAYVTNLIGDYNSGEDGYVESPCIDITTATGGEVVAMKVWWSSENSWDGANLFASYDNGTTWNQVGNDNDPNNWYNDNTINGNPNGSGEGWSGDGNNGSAGWVLAQHNLDSAMMVNNSSLLLRVGFGSDGSVTREGFAFDDVAIGLPTATYEFGIAGTDSIIICDTITTYDLDAGAGYPFYHWSDLQNNFNSVWINDQVLTVTPATAGTYVITVTDSLGMMATDTVYIEFRDFLPPSISDVVDCTPGASVVFDAGSGTIPGNITYLWSTTDVTQTITLTSPGTVSVTKMDTVLGCVVSDTATFSDQPIFSLNTADTSLCAGPSIDLTSNVDANVVQSYLWSDASTGDSLSVTTTDNYILTITDTNGCMGTDSVLITFFALPVVDLGVDTTVCDTAGFVLDAGTAASYLWSDSTTSQTLAPLVTGTYSVTVTDANGCMGTDDVVITITICNTVGVNEFGVNTKINLFPNPTTGNLTVTVADFSKDAILTVMNVYGQVVRSERVTSETIQLDLNDLSDGTYILKLQSENSITTNKFIINR